MGATEMLQYAIDLATEEAFAAGEDVPFREQGPWETLIILLYDKLAEKEPLDK